MSFLKIKIKKSRVIPGIVGNASYPTMYEIQLPVFRTDSSMYRQANELVPLKKEEANELVCT